MEKQQQKVDALKSYLDQKISAIKYEITRIRDDTTSYGTKHALFMKSLTEDS